MKQSVAIVIPIYTNSLRWNERISLIQTISVFSAYDIYFLAPETLDIRLLDVLREEPSFDEKKYHAIKVVRFPDYNFKEIRTYNQLMLNSILYKEFLKYQYILICQTDVFVFRDDLDYFCSLGYDYIGAPWPDGKIGRMGQKLGAYYVGNGGFSLRNPKKCMEIIQNNEVYLQSNYEYEDLFFSMCDGVDFSVAPCDEALKFSFEMKVRQCFKDNHNQLPMGCHAFEKYDLRFWTTYIEECGFRMPNIEGSHLDYYDYENMQRSANYVLYMAHYFEKAKFVKMIEQSGFRPNYPIVIWGAGENGKHMCMLFEAAGFDVKAFVDGDNTLIGKRILNKYVKQLKEVCPTDTNIVIAIRRVTQEMIKTLTEKGFKKKESILLLQDIEEYIYNW